MAEVVVVRRNLNIVECKGIRSNKRNNKKQNSRNLNIVECKG